MSSSGLIYAVIVGAWAAYLVPMWLRRQDELNEARPTERFSTAIRLLSGRAAMERRYAKGREERSTDDAGDARNPGAATDAVDARAFGAPAADEPDDRGSAQSPRGASAAARTKRAKVLARRRRTISVLFLAFTLGAVVAAVGGIAFLWAPGIPALLLSAYIVYLRSQERRRFTFTMDQRKAEVAAERLREHRPRPQEAADAPPTDETGTGAPSADRRPPYDSSPAPTSKPEPPQTAGRRALVEETDHAEWVDQQRDRGRPSGEGWEPVPVPLPTYVTAPVAPRATGSVDLNADDAWSSARSSTASHSALTPPPPPTPERETENERRPEPRSRPSSRRNRGRTPLFDQYADDDRPRAANE